MPQKEISVIIDTNLWISFLINKNFSILDQLIRKGRVKILFDSELKLEIISVATRPKFKNIISNEQLFKLIDLIDVYGEIISVSTKINECRDVKDNFLLSLAVDGNAHILITGDNDLLVLKNIKSTRILKMAEFIEMMKK